MTRLLAGRARCCDVALLTSPAHCACSLTIAVELVANPSVIMMDEPTSGAMPAWPSLVLLLL